MSTTYGIDIPAYQPENRLEFYKAILHDSEAAGFSTAWVGDHLLWHKPRFETFVLLSAFTAITTMRLGTAIALLALRPPWWTAKVVASVAALSRGGFVLGVGSGGEYAREFELARVDRAHRGRLVDEAIDFCRDAWEGRLGTDFSPIPTEHIPLWIGGRSEAAVRRAGERGDGWLALFVSPERFRSQAMELKEISKINSRDVPVAGLAIWIAVSHNGQEVKKVAMESISSEYSLPAERFQRYLVAGTPSEVVEALSLYVEAGAEHIELHIAHPSFSAQLDTIATHVLPQLLDRKI